MMRNVRLGLALVLLLAGGALSAIRGRRTQRGLSQLQRARDRSLRAPAEIPGHRQGLRPRAKPGAAEHLRPQDQRQRRAGGGPGPGPHPRLPPRPRMDLGRGPVPLGQVPGRELRREPRGQAPRRPERDLDRPAGQSRRPGVHDPRLSLLAQEPAGQRRRAIRRGPQPQLRIPMGPRRRRDRAPIPRPPSIAARPRSPSPRPGPCGTCS